jgi:hypothetical protein
MVNDNGSDGDGTCNDSTPGTFGTPSSVATESTVLSPAAKQTYFKEQRIQIPSTEKVCTIKHVSGVTQILHNRTIENSIEIC